MANILVIGEPGTGKSRAMINLDPASTFVIKPNNKSLPFKGWAAKYNEEKENIVEVTTLAEMGDMIDWAVENKADVIKTIVVEDITHFFSDRVMTDAKTEGFSKWNLLGKDVFDNLVAKAKSLPKGVDIIVIGHVEVMQDAAGNAVIGLQTPGKLMEKVVKIPSYFTYVLHTVVTTKNNKSEYKFLTNSDGVRLAKSPEGCFTPLIDNDYKDILDAIHAYDLGE